MRKIFRESISQLSSFFHNNSDKKQHIIINDDIPTRIVSAKTLLQNYIKAVPMLWGHLFPKCGIAVLSGSSDVGKSTFLRQFCIALVTGLKEFLGFPINASFRRVLYVSFEDDEFCLSPRIKKEFIEGSLADDYDNFHFILDCSNPMKEIKKELKKNPVDCVIIDPWLDFVEGDNNLAYNTRYPLKQLRRLALDHNCLIIINHHNRKNDNEDTTSKNSLHGSQSLEAKARVVLMLTKRQNNPHERLLTIAKGNYISDDLKKVHLVMNVNEDFVFEIQSKVDGTVAEEGKNETRNIENEEAIRILLGEGYSPSKIIKELPKRIKKPLKRTAVYNHIKKISNSSTSEFLG